MLEAKVRERTRELEEAQIEIIERLAMAAEFRDDNTGQHTSASARWRRCWPSSSACPTRRWR